MNVSRFFSLAEMTRSDAAARAGIPNEPTEAEIANLRALCTAVLDPLREAIGGPIKVSSGYRSPALNTLLRGAKKSQHLEGKAADLQVSNKSILELFKTVISRGLPFDQVIYEASSETVVWVHVSHNPGANRGQIMRAEFENGRAVRYPVISAQQALAMPDLSVRRDGSVPEWSYIESADEPEGPDEPAPAPQATPPARPKKAARPKKSAKKRAAGKSKATSKTSKSKKKAAGKAKRSSARARPRAKRAAKPRRKR